MPDSMPRGILCERCLAANPDRVTVLVDRSLGTRMTVYQRHVKETIYLCPCCMAEFTYEFQLWFDGFLLEGDDDDK